MTPWLAQGPQRVNRLDRCKSGPNGTNRGDAEKTEKLRLVCKAVCLRDAFSPGTVKVQASEALRFFKMNKGWFSLALCGCFHIFSHK